MSGALKEYVAQRAVTLAREFLTRSPDVQLHEFAGELADFLLTLQPKSRKAREFAVWGAVVRGTERPLDDRTAAAYLTTHLHKSKQQASTTDYYFPMLALVFSMKDNRGFYAWLAEPKLTADGPRLHIADEFACHPIERDTLDEIVTAIRPWYEQLAGAMLISA